MRTLARFSRQGRPLSNEGRATAAGSVQIDGDQPLGIAATRPSSSKRAQINADVMRLTGI